MPPLILVMIGGAIGAGFRYHISGVALRNLGPDYPWGTFIINLVGGLLMGMLAGTLLKPPFLTQGEPLRLFLGVGVLGGFTTFSAFSLETALMIQRGEVVNAAIYALGSMAGSVVLLFAGLMLARIGP